MECVLIASPTRWSPRLRIVGLSGTNVERRVNSVVDAVSSPVMTTPLDGGTHRFAKEAIAS